MAGRRARERVATEKSGLAVWVFQADYRAAQLPPAFGGNPLELGFEPVHHSQPPSAPRRTLAGTGAHLPRAPPGCSKCMAPHRFTAPWDRAL